jgi:hypothetical protein
VHRDATVRGRIAARNFIRRRKQLRKSLVAALAAATALGGTSAAIAQGTGGTLKVKVKPGKAGTKRNPKAIRLSLSVTNNNQSLTAKTIQIFLPKNAKVSAAGRRFCAQEKVIVPGAPGCPSSSKVGVGTASALVGVGTSSPTPLNFKVTAVLLSKKKIGFGIYGQELPVDVVAVGTLGKASGKYGSKLSIAIPIQARQPAPSTYAGLVSLNTVLGSTKGKNPLITTNGCPKNKQHAFKAVIGFEPNPNPPSPASLALTSAAKCS